MRKNRFPRCALLCLLFSKASIVFGSNQAPDESVNEVVEEVRTIGDKRQGDYAYITEDAQKLVETAGTQGDPLAAIFSLPGVVYSAGQGSEPAVRGSSPSDNQYIVDFMPASYIFHEFGVSIFTEYALRDFKMYSAGVGPEYNDVTGAVFDVRLRDPKNQPLGGIVDFSMLRSGVFVESGVTENTAFYASYRQSVLHLFIDEEAISDEDQGIIVQSLPEDTDYQFKYLWTPNDRHRISLNANGATDDAAAEFTNESELVQSNPDFEGDARLENRYQGENIVWEYSSEKGAEFKMGLGVLKDASDLGIGGDYALNTEEKRTTLKLSYSLPLSQQFRLLVGAEQSSHQLDYFLDIPLFICTEFDSDCDLRRRDRVVAENGLSWRQRSMHAVGSWQINDRFTVDLGSQFQTNDFTDEDFINPRISLSYLLFEQTTLVAKAGTYNQFPEAEFIFEETGNPALRSPRSTHYTLGVEQDFSRGWSLLVETYYKTFTALPLALGEDEPDADLLYVNETEGEAYGVDFMLNKNLTDRFYGWISLSYGKSLRENTRTLEETEYFLDTPLIFNWVLNFQATQSLNLGWRWSIRSGAAYTPIVGVQESPFFENAVLPIYGEAYSERLPTFNRLDFRLKWDTTTFGKESALILDVINALNIQNIDDRRLDYDQDPQPGDEPQTVDSVGIGLQPVLSYRVIF